VAMRSPSVADWGSADLAPSTKTRLTFDEAGDFTATNYSGRNFTSASANMGWARFSMACLFAGSPYGSGFLIFAITRPAIRLAALMKSGDLAHDSIGVGEMDQPISLWNRRLRYGNHTRADYHLRPADASNGGGLAGNSPQLQHKPAVLSSSRGRRCPPFPIRSGIRCPAGAILLVDAPDE